MAPPKHPPPPVRWHTPPASAHAGAATAQPMRAFAAHQRPPGQRDGSTGDELVGGADGRFQLRRHSNHVLTQPSGVYNFVRVQGATRNQAATMLSARAPHASLAGGRPVLYAGTAAFDGGRLQWWSNYSGTYQPQAEFHHQAALPDDKFVPWQRLQLGGVGLQRGMLADHRGVGLPARGDDKPDKGTQTDKGAAKTTATGPQQPQAAKADETPKTPSGPTSGQNATGPSAQMMKRASHLPPATKFGPRP